MNKTVSVNISGQKFNIEENAFNTLKHYLDTIKKYLYNAEGADEVMNDIESRIAELFLERTSDTKNVINKVDVDAVIGIMGKPEDYVMDDYGAEEPVGATQFKGRKRFFRDIDHGMIGGVCSGLSANLGIDALWLRLIFILLFISGGFGLITYIILWIIIPKAETTTQKLQMYGKPVTVENIKKAVDEGIDSVSGKASSKSTGRSSSSLQSGIQSFLDLMASILRGLFKVIGKVLGVFLLIGGLIAFVSTLLLLLDPGMFFIPSPIAGGTFAWSDINEVFLGDNPFISLMFLGIGLVTLVPLIAMIYIGLKLLFKIQSNNKAWGLGLFGAWIMGIILVSFAGLKIGKEFQSEDRSQSFERIQLVEGTLHLTASASEIYDPHHHSEFKIEDGIIYHDDVDLTILKNNFDTSIELEIIKYSSGKSDLDANLRIENMEYHWIQDSLTLSFDPYFTFNKDDHFRNQHIDLILRIPEGQSIYLDETIKHMLYDVPNVQHYWDRRMVNHTWLMTEKGLSCLTCPYEEERNEETEELEGLENKLEKELQEMEQELEEELNELEESLEEI